MIREAGKAKPIMNQKIVTMTVLELIAKLGELPLDAPIILASDEAGSTFLGLHKLELVEGSRVVLWPASSKANNESA